MIDYETKLAQIIKNDDYIMSILKTLEKLKVNDAWVAAGLIRNKVWDYLHNQRTAINDIDVIFFDRNDTSLNREKVLEKKLETLMPNQPWSVKNQARMHLRNDFNCFNSSYDGVAHFPETPTAIAVKLVNNELKIMAPYGLEDLFNRKVKPTPYFKWDNQLNTIYCERMNQKRWTDIWKDLSVKDGGRL